MKRILPVILIVITIFVPQTLAQTKQDSIVYLRQQGIQLFVQGDYRSAASIFQVCISDSSKDTLAWYYAGLCAYQLGNYPLAQTYFSISMQNDSLSKSSCFQRGRVNAALGLYPAAIEDYENTIGKDSTFRPARIELLRILCLVQRYDQALARVDTNSIDEIVMVGRGLVTAMKYQTALPIARRAAFLDYKNFAALMLLGDVYFGMEEFNFACSIYSQLQYRFKDVAPVIRKLALCLGQFKTKENYISAIELMQKYFALSGDINANDMGYIGKWFYARKEYDSSLVYFNRAVRLDSAGAIPHYNLGSALLKIDSLIAAKNEFTTAYLLSKNSLDLNASILTSLGGIYYKQRSFQKAINSYKLAIELSSLNAQAMYGLALCYDVLPSGKDNALEWYKKFLQNSSRIDEQLTEYAKKRIQELTRTAKEGQKEK
jgi:tetratricopeptide (TPR) repeat protein